MSGIGTTILVITAVVIAAIGFAVKWRGPLRPLRVGARVRLSGGYDEPPRWLNGQKHLEGHVLKFIETDGGPPAAVVKLDGPLSFDGLSSDIVVLRLRYEDGRWGARDIVHIELWRDEPSAPLNRGIDAADSADRRWVESHASYRAIA